MIRKRNHNVGDVTYNLGRLLDSSSRGRVDDGRDSLSRLGVYGFRHYEREMCVC
jgi:hypothetical protein